MCLLSAVFFYCQINKHERKKNEFNNSYYNRPQFTLLFVSKQHLNDICSASGEEKKKTCYERRARALVHMHNKYRCDIRHYIFSTEAWILSDSQNDLSQTDD